MAITFDPDNKIVQLDSSSVSEKQLWSAYVDWAVTSDNLKYGAGMSQLGGVAPVALYIFLELGWRIRPVEADGITTITGNLLASDGSSPIAATAGNFNVLVNMETPVLAAAIEINSGSGLTAAEQARLLLIANILEADEEITATTYRKLHKDTKAALVSKDYAKSGSNIDLSQQ